VESVLPKHCCNSALYCYSTTQLSKMSSFAAFVGAPSTRVNLQAAQHVDLAGAAPPAALPSTLQSSAAPWLACGAVASVAAVSLSGQKKYSKRSHGIARRATAPIGTSTTLMTEAEVAKQPGVSAPMGEPGVSYWDPLGLATNCPADRFRWYQQAEKKHGRVAMLATLGFIVQHSYKFNLNYPYDGPLNMQLGGQAGSIPSGVAALSYAPCNYLFACLVLIAGIIELRASDEGRAPGDFGDPAGWKNLYGNDEDLQNYELNHGRLAMLGAIGTIMAEWATGLDGPEQWANAGAAWARTMAMTSPQGAVGPLSSYM